MISQTAKRWYLAYYQLIICIRKILFQIVTFILPFLLLCPDFIGTRTRHAQMRTLIIRSIVDLITDTSVKIQIHQPLQKEQDMIDRCFGQRIQFPDNSFSETHLHHAIRFIRCGTQPCRHPQGFPSSVGQSPGILLRPCTPPRRSDCTRLL